MSQPKYLRNRVTGIVFPFCEHLMSRNRNMEPCNSLDGESGFEEVEVIVTKGAKVSLKAAETVGGELENDNKGQGIGEVLMIGDVSLSDATKDQLLDFAEKAFGKKLNAKDKIDALRAQVTVLLEE